MTKRIKLTSSKSAKSADVAVEVSVTANEAFQLSDAVQQAVLKDLNGKCEMPPGRYALKVLLVLTEDTDGPGQP